MRVSYTPLERLILMSLRLTPYQTEQELFRSTGGVSGKNFRRTLQGLLGQNQIAAHGTYYALETGQDVLDRGIVAIRQWHATMAPLTAARDTPESEVYGVLHSALLDEWGRALPNGLTINELQWATRYGEGQVIEGLEALKRRITDDRWDDWSYRLSEVRDGEGWLRYKLVYADKRQA